MSKFLGTYAYSTPQKKLGFEELNEKRHKAGTLCNKNKPEKCVIFFVDADSKDLELSKFTALIEQF